MMQSYKLKNLISSYEHNKFNFEGLGMNPDNFAELQKQEQKDMVSMHLEHFK